MTTLYNEYEVNDKIASLISKLTEKDSIISQLQAEKQALQNAIDMLSANKITDQTLIKQRDDAIQALQDELSKGNPKPE